jgi:hypothetical protein
MATKLYLYPAPPGEEPSNDFSVRIDGEPAFVYQARVSAMPVNQVWPGYQRPLDQTELASFAYFDIDGPVQVEITAHKPIDSVTIRPLSYGIQPVVSGQTISFRLEKRCPVVVEVNDWHNALHLFANPPETNQPDPADPHVRSFGPGVHQAGRIVLHSGETLYIAGGAVVHGVVYAENAHDIRILGRGILDASHFDRFDAGPMVELRGCTRARIEGIVLRDPHVWTVMPAGCRDVHIANIKLIGLWRYNADGIDVVNSQDVLVEDCFVRSFDDSLVVKGLDHDAAFQSPDTSVRNVRWRNCVVWNDWGRGLEIGAETQAPRMEQITFENCDIVHFVHRAMDIQHGDRALVRDVHFEGIRVEEPIVEGARTADHLHTPDEVGLLAELIIAATMWNKDTERGRIEGVRFKDIQVLTGQPLRTNIAGFDADHLVRDVSFENLTWPGRRVSTLETGLFCLNEFVQDVRVY